VKLFHSFNKIVAQKSFLDYNRVCIHLEHIMNAFITDWMLSNKVLEIIIK
jgi:hypothetical protein